ncbi:Uncharacterised protein [Neisseria gonorrhoeae]|uniref:Uncharacterized protein n=1 Tax=Neisseria gonorrhoeae TaxID=485 RepID=A0A378VSZ1_NEIGO|nr:Uncharacterised protein [Neisseria gonorrhoeae]
MLPLYSGLIICPFSWILVYQAEIRFSARCFSRHLFPTWQYMPPYFITLLTMENTKSAAKTPTTIQPASIPVRFCGFQSVFAVSATLRLPVPPKPGGGCYNSQFCAVLRQVLIIS